MTPLLRGLAVSGLLLLSACVAHQQPSAPPEVIARAAYVPPGPATVTLLTMINNRSGSGGHSALMIDGAQRVLFDPAGSWYHPQIPERGDVLYGMSPAFLDFYMDYHARETYHVVVQEIEVSAATALALTQAVQSYGAVNQSQCALSVSSVLGQVPGFEAVGRSWFPKRVMTGFAELPGVRTTRIYDDDSDDNLELLQAQARQAQRAQEAAERAAE